MDDESKLEDLGQDIMRCSVQAEFLDLRDVVDSLDRAFSYLVRYAMEEKQRRSREAERGKSLSSGEDVSGS